MLSRRSLLALPLATLACSRKRAPFRGYAFIANQEGNAIAAVDLEVFAVAKHIPLPSAPSQVLAAQAKPSVFVLTPDTGTVHRIDAEQLRYSSKLTLGARAASMVLNPNERLLYVLMREPRALIALRPEDLQVAWKIALPDEALEFSITGDGLHGVVGSASGVRLLDLENHGVGPAAHGDFGPVCFLADGKTMIAANRGARMISLFDVATGHVITHLPISVRPDQMCFNRDGGQLFITGEGMDAVVVVYPYRTPQVAQTVLAGHAPGAMAASIRYLLVASPQSGDVSILDIDSRRVVAVVQVGTDPGSIAVTPDDQYALVLNRNSGDVSVLRLGTLTPNRLKSAGLFTVIPVGSRPVSAAVRAI